ncbi:CotD family spore coat protein [Oceanobacillus timonensis]|uniref:CotD family spore coat protein n=1 Tax=Oceanobacillus timonensis TaxID=1926285 RepID=UPI0009BADC07|nr:CotD family spore coat protein [Oceanobacillus timonensis]
MQRKGQFNHRHPNEKTIVHPTKHQYVHTSSESVVHHIHPIHTTYVNHPVQRHPHHQPYGGRGFIGRPQAGPRPPFPPGPNNMPGQMPPGPVGEGRNHPGFRPHRRPGMW